MPLTSGLPVSRLVTVQVSLTTPAIVAESVNTCMLLGTSDVIDATERMREYANILEVAQQFDTTTEEYRAALTWFSQNPSPHSLHIGRWVRVPSPGILIGASLAPAEQRISQWAAITSGSFAIAVDGVGPLDVLGVSFATQTNLNGVASQINTALTAAGFAATMIWNARMDRFELRTNSTGPTASISFMTAATGGVDISEMLKMTMAHGPAAYVVPGLAPETALAAAVEIDGLFSAKWYALVCPSADDEDHQMLAAYSEASDPPHFYGVSTDAEHSLSDMSDVDIGYILASYGFNKTAVMFSRTNYFVVMSFLARILTTHWGGSNTTITLMYKQAPGVIAETISTQQANTLQRKHVNVFVNYANGARLIQYGTSASGEFVDTIIGADALALEVQARLFNTLYTAITKVPQTDAGMELLKTSAAAGCAMYVSNGWLATGTWNAQGFGDLSQGDLVPGFYIFTPSMLLQNQADRQARRAPLMQIAAKTAGAIHTADVLIWVNQ
jgi:hypothetical protein